MYDVVIVGAGIAGMATAVRLQAQGLTTVVCEAHGQPGGCAGFFRRRGFAFDVGATTLVDFEPGGVGGELLASVGMPPLDGVVLSGFVAWLPDRVVTLHHSAAELDGERSFGSNTGVPAWTRRQAGPARGMPRLARADRLLARCRRSRRRHYSHQLGD